jgi:hypothetical protein
MGGRRMTNEEKIALNKLTNFLNEHDCYEQFIKNLVAFGKLMTINDLVLKASFLNAESYMINLAFKWKDTPQRHDFWSELDCFFMCKYDEISGEEPSTINSIWEEDQ